MKSLVIGLFTIGLFSCNSENKTKHEAATSPSKEQAIPDFNVALSFINDYTNFCTKPRQLTKTDEWIRDNSWLPPLAIIHAQPQFSNISQNGPCSFTKKLRCSTLLFRLATMGEASASTGLSASTRQK